MKQISLMNSFKLKPKSNSTLAEDKSPNKIFSSNHNDQGQRITQKKIEELEINPEKNKMGKIGFMQEEDYGFQQKTLNVRKRKMQIEDDDADCFKYQSKRQQQSYDSSEDKVKKKKIISSKSAKKKNMSEQQDEKPNRPNRSTSKKQVQPKPIVVEGGEIVESFTDVTPQWATPEGCRDAKGRRPDHPDYDNTTLYVPPEAYKGFTQTMKQFWKIKSQNHDKIVLFKLGKFYEMFYEDAAIGNKYLDLKWMGTKMHVGFPQKCLDKYAHEFVQLGFKLVIVEQLQTPDQMKQRLNKDKNEGRKSQKTLQRGVTQVLTKGTIVSFEDQNQYLPNYLIAVSKHNNLIAYSLLQMGTNLILMGLAPSIQEFKTMLFQTRPVQLLYDSDNLPFEIVDLMKKNWLQMVLTKLPNRDNAWHPMNSKNEIQTMIKEGKLSSSKIFESIEQLGSEEDKLIYASLSGMFKYLKNCMKFQYIMGAIKFNFYSIKNSNLNMVLDSQALQHLQIFQTPLGEKDSLFGRIDKTQTKFGKRLFRRWLMQPLLNPSKINQRLDAIQDLQNYSLDRNRASDIFSKLPDLQKIVNRLYHYSIKTIAQKAVYFEDVSSIRLKEFRQLIQHFNRAWNAVEILRKNRANYKSRRLIQLITFQSRKQIQSDDIYNEQEDQDNTLGYLPLIRQHLHEFESYIKWEGDTPVPQKGLVSSYDNLQDQLSQVKGKLEHYIEGVRMSSGIVNIRYVHTKQRYEMEIPEALQKRRMDDMIFTSKRSGFSRYVTQQSRRLVSELQSVQQQIKQQMGLFVGFFFEEFRKKQKIWEKFIAVLAELDCFIGLSLYSYQSSGVRPQFIENKFEIIQAKHPCLNVLDVIANDINLNSKIMLLTGPNMGGKSTVLRTTCVMAILAQIGCFVSAQKYECDIIDRIFTRIGASDKLEEGKSTFFIQMEQTKSVLSEGTSRSLAIMDELGRGTSTFDGMAIAYSVLKNLIQTIQCRCIFATHYHSLSEEFENISTVKMMMMDYLISDEKIVFLYKLNKGKSGQSFGINVAKVVKIPNEIIERAKVKAKAMQQQIMKKDQLKKYKKARRFMIE